MNLVCLGTGEAYDELCPNNSHLVMAGTNLLLDCGRSAADQWWRYGKGPDFLDMLFLSHMHDDHVDGVPPICKRMCQDGRTKPLLIITEECNVSALENRLAGYSLRFPVIFARGVQEGQYPEKLAGLDLSFASTVHGFRNLAIRISDGKETICYSGDGEITPRSEALYRGAGILIHEANLYDQKREGHTCMVDAIAMAERQGVGTLLLTHLERKLRRARLAELRKLCQRQKVRVIIPDPMDTFDL